MTGILLSIIMILGLPGGPTDFSDTCTTDNSGSIAQAEKTRNV